MGLRAAIIALFSFVCTVTALAEQSASPVVFPRQNSIVGTRVNVVLDPTEVPFFQVLVGKTEYPVVDTSTGKHAYQGLGLERGLNKITIRVFAPASEDKDRNGDKDGINKQKLALIATWERRVFSVGGFSTDRNAPPGFRREFFHSREHETSCSGCHNLDAPPRDAVVPKKPEDVICYVCHRKTPTGAHIHGPAAVWNCIACHNPEMYPVKYQFMSADPWKVSKSFQAVVPQVFTIDSASVFNPELATLLVDKDKVTDKFQEVIKYVNQNPGDLVRIEVHTDDKSLTNLKQNSMDPMRLEVNTDRKPLTKTKGKMQPVESSQALTEARAKALAGMFTELGVLPNRLTAAGMGDKLPKSPLKTPEGRALNNRIEIVVYPADVNIVNSQKLPVLEDRERVIVNLNYKYVQGPSLKKLRVTEELSKDIQYVNGSSFFRGKAVTPTVKNDDVTWELGDMETNFTETMYFVVKKARKDISLSDIVSVKFSVDDRELSRDFDPKIPAGRSFTIRDACMKCHADIMKGFIKHGPADAGYCGLCHNPHASKQNKVLRRPVWDLCTTCHAEQRIGAHVTGNAMRIKKGKKSKGSTHPTRLKRDPMRPGKRLTCASCHDAHSAESKDLFTYNARTREKMCDLCHFDK